VRALARSALPVVLTPGVVHLPTVPAHRKVNRVDMGTAEKVCAVALAVCEQAQRLGHPLSNVSLVLLELGGAFTAAVAVERGRIVDGVGGTGGPLGWQSSGALDGEVAFLAGTVEKDLLFRGGVESIRAARPTLGGAALEAFIEGAVKAVQSLRVSAPGSREVVLSGRHAGQVHAALADRLGSATEVVPLRGFARAAKQGAQGAALLADGLMNGRHSDLVASLRLRHAKGSALDHLFVVDAAAARRRLGLDVNG